MFDFVVGILLSLHCTVRE